jgi:hypothetical protein
MTLAEVEAIIGAPPGDYGVGECLSTFVTVGSKISVASGIDAPRRDLVQKDWHGQDHTITVWFEDGKLHKKQHWREFREYESSFDLVLCWIGIKQKRESQFFTVGAPIGPITGDPR